ncbi:MAG: toprim domain-containing protein, partial [Acidobacteria bacterium]|nr:toprim domain-containing protein [Acidobacteriota bacterium]
MTEDPTVALQQSMAAYDLHPGDIVWDGKVHRFPGAGKGPRNTAGWYIAFPDRRGAVFGDHSAGLNAKWQADRKEEPSADTLKRWAAENAKKEKTLARDREAATARAKEVWNAASDDPAKVLAHPYLQGKDITEDAPELRITTEPETFTDSWDLPPGTLLIPMWLKRELVNVQCIPPDGNRKLFWPKAAVDGAASLIGAKRWDEKADDKRVFVTEGWATGWSVHQATGRPVAVCFSTSGILPVTKRLADKYKTAEFIIAADNDRWSVVKQPHGLPDIPNPGVHYAKEAAAELGDQVQIAIPDFQDLEGEPTDFDDLRRLEGIDAVKRWLDPDKAGDARTVAGPDRAPPGDPSDEGETDTPAPVDQGDEAEPPWQDNFLPDIRQLAAAVAEDGWTDEHVGALDDLKSAWDETKRSAGPEPPQVDGKSAPDAMKALRKHRKDHGPPTATDHFNPDGTPRAVLTPQDWAMDPPPVEWVFTRPWGAGGTVAMLTGRGAVGKTQLAVQAALAVAAGKSE